MFQWKSYMNVEIKMEPQVGRDGGCGNFIQNMRKFEVAVKDKKDNPTKAHSMEASSTQAYGAK